MKLSRREVLMAGLGGLGLYLIGCAQEKTAGLISPGTVRPVSPVQPPASGKAQLVQPPVSVPPRPSASGPAMVSPPSADRQAELGRALEIIARSRWARGAPIPSKLLPMGYVEKITVHHEGWTPVYFSDFASTAERLEKIRRTHVERLGAGDIGYHYVIDRAGRIWQGRDLQYQGAHVRSHNPHNIGIMCLGNFEVQQPSDAQLAALQRLLQKLSREYRVPVRAVFTHRELNRTECPGDILQRYMVAFRRNGLA